VKTEYRARGCFVNMLQKHVNATRSFCANPAFRNGNPVRSVQFHLGMRSRILPYPSGDMLYSVVPADEDARQIPETAGPDDVHVDVFQLFSPLGPSDPSTGPCSRPFSHDDLPVSPGKDEQGEGRKDFSEAGQAAMTR